MKKIKLYQIYENDEYVCEDVLNSNSAMSLEEIKEELNEKFNEYEIEVIKHDSSENWSSENAVSYRHFYEDGSVFDEDEGVFIKIQVQHIVVEVEDKYDLSDRVDLQNNYEWQMLNNFKDMLQHSDLPVEELKKMLDGVNGVNEFAWYLTNVDEDVRSIKLVESEKIDESGYYEEDGRVYLSTINLTHVAKNVYDIIQEVIDNKN